MKIALKDQLLGVFFIFLLIVSGLSIWSVVNFQWLKKSIVDIMDDNYKSIVVAQRMIEAIERQDSAELALMFGGRGEEPAAVFRQNEAIFKEALRSAEKNITEQREGDTVREIGAYYAEYIEKFDALLRTRDAGAFYYAEILPLFEKCKEKCRFLSDLNQRGMLLRQEKADEMAGNATFATIAAVACTILFGFSLVMFVSQKMHAQDIARLKEIAGMKDAFIATASHEFRTPLTSIKMAIGLLLKGDAAPDDRELLESVAEDTGRLIDLVNNLLDLSRIEAGKIDIALKAQPLSPIVESSARTFAAQLADNRIALAIHVPEEVIVFADFEKLERVFNNLISNAIRYVSHGGDGAIEIDGAREGDGVRVVVRDNGVGIPAGMEESVFDRFVQLGRDNASSGGAGLGLSICREIVNAHGGSIRAANNEGAGCSFILTLKKGRAV